MSGNECYNPIDDISKGNLIDQFDDLSNSIHQIHKQWWQDIDTGEPIKRNVGEMLCLVHSEISEAMEGHRKSLPDDKLPHRKMFEVELSDAVIRILDIAGGMNLDLGGAIYEKLVYNQSREDHQVEHRKSDNGTKY